MKVLFPVDGSDSALDTIRQAARLLDTVNTEVYLLTVTTPVVTDIPVVALEPDVQVPEGILDVAEAVARGEGFQNIAEKKYIYHHDLADVICEYADEKRVDEILIGSHGHRGLARFLTGSVSEKVLKRARQPVVLLRNDKNHTVEISHFDQAELKPEPPGKLS